MGGGSRRQLSSITRIARHHSATTNERADVFTFQNHWRNLGWHTGGYHEVILRDGTVQLCYPQVITNGIRNHNNNTYHICLVGSGSFTNAQERAFTDRANAVRQRFGISVSNVLGHREFSGTNTACPGINMDVVRSRLGGSVPAAPARPTSPPAPTPAGQTFVQWMQANGMDSSFNNRARLAAQHGISNFTGTAEQNLRLWDILRTQNGGSTPTAPDRQYFPATSKGGNSIVDALRAINVDNSFNNRQRIAQANEINNFNGTADQNTRLLQLLRKGRLVRL